MGPSSDPPTYIEECRFDQLNFAALELVTFNQVKMIWAEKKKETLTEVSYLLGLLGCRFFRALRTTGKNIRAAVVLAVACCCSANCLGNKDNVQF